VAILLTCSCGRKLQIKDDFAGQEGTCPSCGRTLRIPSGNAGAEPPLVTRAVPVREDASLPEARPVRPQDDEADDGPVTNHGSDPLPEDADFFVPAPADIGPVISAYTTLHQGQEPWSMGLRLLVGGLAGLGGLLLSALIVTWVGTRNPIWLAVIPFGLGALGFAIGMLSSGFKHTCTYIGREGVARFGCSGSRDNLATDEVFRFRDATDLRTSQTLHYTNGAYTHTSYTFTWSDVGGRSRFVISGQHKSQAGAPPTKDLFHFARAAEVAWTVYLLGQVSRQVELSDFVLFKLKGSRWIRLGQGVIVFGLGGEPEEWDAADVDAASVKQGVVRIKRLDAQEGWFSSRGVHKFSFEDLSNAQLFFHLLDKLVGVRVE
jgi:hypothetical protein